MSKEVATTGAQKKKLPDVTMEGVTLLNGQFKNFSGEERKYNPAGSRNFAVQLEPGLAQQMLDDGWNIKYLQPRDEGDDGVHFLRVKVKFNQFPPRVVLVTSRGRTQLPEDMVGMLDWIDIANVDMIVRPYAHDFQGGGIAAYLKSIYVTVAEDDLEKKYANVPELTHQAAPLQLAGPQDEDVIDVEAWEVDGDGDTPAWEE